MNIIVVDDEELALQHLMSLLKKAEPEASIVGFEDAKEAFLYMESYPIDIAFLDIKMGQYNGIRLAQKFPTTNIIFVTAYSEYLLDAFSIHASGYLLKPVLLKDLKNEIKNLRYPIKRIKMPYIFIQTFGNFEIFINGTPIEFPRNKCKECLAYLVDRRGTVVSNEELATILWEDKPYDRAIQNYLHQIIHNLIVTLKNYKIDYIIHKNNQGISIDLSSFVCDYYETLEGNTKYLKTFTGEYMSNYSWAEYTLGELYVNFHGSRT